MDEGELYAQALHDERHKTIKDLKAAKAEIARLNEDQNAIKQIVAWLRGQEGLPMMPNSCEIKEIADQIEAGVWNNFP